MRTRPDYVDYENEGRDEFLSRIGAFPPPEREVFRRLCGAWQDVIPYDGFIAKLSDLEDGETILQRLMAGLQRAEVGLITTKLQEETRVPGGIVLTLKGSVQFWVDRFAEAYLSLQSTTYWRLPIQADLIEAGFKPPDYHIVDTDSAELCAAYQRQSDEPVILRMRLLEECRILLSGFMVHEVIDKAREWFLSDLADRGFLAEIARIKDTSLSEIQKSVSTGDRNAWLDLTRSVIAERATLAYRRNAEETDQIFQVAFLILNFVEAQIGVAADRKEHEEAVDREVEAIEDAVLSVEGGVMAQDTFAELVDKAQDRLGKDAVRLTDRLTKRLLTPRPRRRLPMILYIHGVYIHRDRIRDVLDQRHARIRSRLLDEYSDLMEAFLRGRVMDAGEVFGSRDRVDDDILARVERHDPLIGEFLSRAQLLAEALIHDARQRQAGARPDELKAAISRYINVAESRLQPLSQIFGINVPQVFDRTFARMNVFRQLLLKISGRYESIRQTYLRRFPQSASRLDSEFPRPVSRSASGRLREAESSRGRGETDTIGGRGRSAPSARQRMRSPRETEQAWKEFDRAIHSRPRPPEDSK
jgi:hypothetical protein